MNKQINKRIKTHPKKNQRTSKRASERVQKIIINEIRMCKSTQLHTHTHMNSRTQAHNQYSRAFVQGQLCAMVLLIAVLLQKWKIRREGKKTAQQQQRQQQQQQKHFQFSMPLCRVYVLVSVIQLCCVYACVLYIFTQCIEPIFQSHTAVSLSVQKLDFAFAQGKCTRARKHIDISLWSSLSRCFHRFSAHSQTYWCSLFPSLSALTHSLSAMYSLDSFVVCWYGCACVCSFFLLLFWCVRIRILYQLLNATFSYARICIAERGNRNEHKSTVHCHTQISPHTKDYSRKFYSFLSCLQSSSNTRSNESNTGTESKRNKKN